MAARPGLRQDESGEWGSMIRLGVRGIEVEWDDIWDRGGILTNLKSSFEAWLHHDSSSTMICLSCNEIRAYLDTINANQTILPLERLYSDQYFFCVVFLQSLHQQRECFRRRMQPQEEYQSIEQRIRKMTPNLGLKHCSSPTWTDCVFTSHIVHYDYHSVFCADNFTRITCIEVSPKIRDQLQVQIFAQ